MFIVTNREVDETSTDPAIAFGSRPNPNGPNELRMAWAERIGRKYREDGEFKETVDRYIQQFETLMEQTARSDRENVLVETYLTSQTGKVYVALASAIGRLA